jgi:hypothetical protein
MNETRRFHLGDILSVTSGRFLSPDGIDGVYRILNWMTGESLFTHQLPRASRECEARLLAQHPDLAKIRIPEDLSGEGPCKAWLAGQVAQYGEYLEVAPLAPDDHTRIDPATEIGMVAPQANVIELRDDE